MIQEERNRPVLRTVTERGEKYSALAMHARPAYRVRCALIGCAFHPLRLERKNHMQIGGKILKRIPLLGETYRRSHAFQSGKFRVLHNEVSSLQPGSAPMGDELATQHPQIRIRLIAVRDITIRPVLCVGFGVEGVAGGMNAHKSQSAAHRVEQRLLALRRHGRISVCPRLGQVSGGKEEYSRILLSEIFRIEDPSVL